MDITTDKTTDTTTAYARWRARLSERFGENRPGRDPKDRIDPQSWMVGLFTLVVISGVVAAMVLAVIQHIAK